MPLRSLLELSPMQWSVLVVSPFYLAAAEFRLRRQGLRACVTRINARKSGRSVPQAAENAREITRAMNMMARVMPWRPRCLSRSLALVGILSGKDIPAQVMVGIPEGFSQEESAHAWVECEGEVINDRPDIAGDFRPFPSL